MVKAIRKICGSSEKVFLVFPLYDPFVFIFIRFRHETHKERVVHGDGTFRAINITGTAKPAFIRICYYRCFIFPPFKYILGTSCVASFALRT
jgi:hypothetical protein